MPPGTLDILIVEDNPSDVYLVREALDCLSIGYSLRKIPDGEDAIEFVSRIGEHGLHCPGLAIIDICLPRVSWLSVLARLRQKIECAEVPVIVYTSSHAPSDKESAEMLNTRFFRKPTELDEWMKFRELVEGMTGIYPTNLPLRADLRRCVRLC